MRMKWFRTSVSEVSVVQKRKCTYTRAHVHTRIHGLGSQAAANTTTQRGREWPLQGAVVADSIVIIYISVIQVISSPFLSSPLFVSIFLSFFQFLLSSFVGFRFN